MTPDDPDFYKELLNHISDGVYFVDRDRRIQYWNDGACRLTGYTAKELQGRPCHDNILCHVDFNGNKLCWNGCLMSACIEDGHSHEAHVFLRHKEGRRVPVKVRAQPMRGTDGSIIGALEIFCDDSAHSEALRRTAEMARLAFLDHLTQIPNRRFVEMSLHSWLSEFQVHKDPFGILLLDLDHFKTINDSFGHCCGDRVLQQVAKTLAGSIRPSDIVGRWGGDEFLALVRNVNLQTIKMLADRCIAMIKKTSVLNCDQSPLSLSISVGAAIAHSDDTAEELLSRVDVLLYKSKADGRDCATTE